MASKHPKRVRRLHKNAARSFDDYGNMKESDAPRAGDVARAKVLVINQLSAVVAIDAIRIMP